MSGAIGRFSRRPAAAAARVACGVMVVALATLGLSACEVPPEEKGCEHQDVQTMAKKLVAMQFDEAMKPRTESQERIDALSKSGRNADTETLLNTLRSHAVDPKRVTLTDIVEVRGPKSAEPKNGEPKDAASEAHPVARLLGMGGDYLYVCSAKASIKLPAEAVQRLKEPLKGSGMLDADTGLLSPRIVYTTEVDGDRRLGVGMRFESLTLGFVLKAALRTVVDEPDAAAAAASAASGSASAVSPATAPR